MKKLFKNLRWLAALSLVTAAFVFTGCDSEDSTESPAAEATSTPAATPTSETYTVTGGTYDGTSALTPTSKVFISGRTIEIPALWVCDHEVTQKEYSEYCKFGDAQPSETYGVGDNYPAYYVNLYDAVVYCNLRSMAENLTPVYKIGEETDPTKWSGIVGDAETK